MLELLRTFLGYCHVCRRPTLVGEFKVMGWQHVFNVCDVCLGTSQERVAAAGQDVVAKAALENPMPKELRDPTREKKSVA